MNKISSTIQELVNYKNALALVIVFIIMIVWMNATIQNEVWQFVAKSDIAAVCYLIPTPECPGIAGSITFRENNKKGVLEINFNLHGLTPGEHGVHVHEYGDIRPIPGADTAKLECCKGVGDHYNPNHVAHGGLDTGHAGDLGNILADMNGNVSEYKESTTISIRGARGIVGRALVIHDKKDDLGHGNNSESKINGNSGARIACGVIGYMR